MTTRWLRVRRAGAALAAALALGSPAAAQYVGYSGGGGGGAGSVGLGLGFGPGGRISVSPMINLTPTGGSGPYSAYGNSRATNSRAGSFYSRRARTPEAAAAASVMRGGYGESGSGSSEFRRSLLSNRLYELDGAPQPAAAAPSAVSQLERAALTAPDPEVTGGTALNRLVEAIAAATPAQVPDVPLPEGLLARTDIEARGERGFTNQVGMLRAGGKVEWPAPLLPLVPAADRAAVEALMADAAAQVVAAGRAEDPTHRAAEAAARKIDAAVKTNIQNIPATDFFEIRRFQRELEASVNGMTSPAVAKILRNPEEVRKIRTVDQLVKYLTANQLRFARAPRGQEQAYRDLRAALSRFVQEAGMLG